MCCGGGELILNRLSILFEIVIIIHILYEKRGKVAARRCTTKIKGP